MRQPTSFPALHLPSIYVTDQVCNSYCYELGAVYMGIQRGDECWCGINENIGYNKYGDGTCDISCAGYTVSGEELTYDANRQLNVVESWQAQHSATAVIVSNESPRPLALEKERARKKRCESS